MIRKATIGRVVDELRYGLVGLRLANSTPRSTENSAALLNNSTEPGGKEKWGWVWP